MSTSTINAIRALVRPILTAVVVLVSCWLVLAKYPPSALTDGHHVITLMAASVLWGERSARNVIRTWKAQGKGKG